MSVTERLAAGVLDDLVEVEVVEFSASGLYGPHAVDAEWLVARSRRCLLRLFYSREVAATWEKAKTQTPQGVRVIAALQVQQQMDEIGRKGRADVAWHSGR